MVHGSIQYEYHSVMWSIHSTAGGNIKVQLSQCVFGVTGVHVGVVVFYGFTVSQYLTRRKLLCQHVDIYV